MLSLFALLSCVGNSGEPEVCPEDYTIDDFAEDYAEAHCYMAETCQFESAAGLTHEECLDKWRTSVYEDVAWCEAEGGELVDVCREWSCTGEMIEATSDCETASNTCDVPSMFEDEDNVRCGIVDDRR